MPIPDFEKSHPDLPPPKRKKVKITFKSALTAVLVAGLGLALAGLLAFTLAMAWISRDLPNPNTLMTREIPQSTKIYDRTGQVLLYEIHGEEKRSLVKIEDIPETMKQATISIEDRQFYEHHGVNWMSIMRAVYVDVIQQRKAQGASTLTQQLVKNAILTNEKSIIRKLKEMLLALQIERRFTKDQILQMYLNEIPYGSMVYGVGSAAETYFGKSVKDLTLDEAALLAAIPQAPDRYNPYGSGVSGDNRNLLVKRQRQVLDAMVRDGYIKQEQSDEAKKIDTLAKLVPQKMGEIKAPHFVMYVRSQLFDLYGQKRVEQGGLRVTTTLDWDKQQIAEEEVKKGVEKYGAKYNFNNSSMVALDPKNGQLLAMVGSKDYFDDNIDGQVNVAVSLRQPGSSFKPIVYTAGFIKGYTSETVLWDVLTTFKTEIGKYEPHNYSNTYNGPVTARKALQGSLNVPAVKMLYLVGIQRVLDFAEQLGYTSFAERDRFGLSLVLGGGEVELLEHANAYAAFANRGQQYPVTSIIKVTEADGSPVDEWVQPEPKKVMPQEAADTITNVLSDNAARAYVFGGGSWLVLPGRTVAAKTGTTNNFKDAWTMGYTPSLVAGVWVGNTTGTSMNGGADGSVVAAPIWNTFMKRALADTPKEEFPPMPPIQTTKPMLVGKSAEKEVEVDKISGKLATEFTPPELKEKRKAYEGHCELWYVDKDDPLGPPPTNPGKDPQFQNWETAVQAWIEKKQWHTTSTAPTEYDDVHTATSKPTVTILSPQINDSLYSRDLTVQFSVQASRPIHRVEIKIDGTDLGVAGANQTSASVRIPNSVAQGFHDITVKAYDDVSNTSEAKVTVNLVAQEAAIQATITSPGPGATLTMSNFPVPVNVQINDLEDVKKIDLFVERNGAATLVGSVIAPSAYGNQVNWNAAPEPGTVSLYAEVVRGDGSSNKGSPITVNVTQ